MAVAGMIAVSIALTVEVVIGGEVWWVLLSSLREVWFGVAKEASRSYHLTGGYFVVVDLLNYLAPN